MLEKQHEAIRQNIKWYNEFLSCPEPIVAYFDKPTQTRGGWFNSNTDRQREVANSPWLRLGRVPGLSAPDAVSGGTRPRFVSFRERKNLSSPFLRANRER